MNITSVLLFALLFVFALRLDMPAYAYLDPGTGSMVLQMILGGVAGILVVGKLYWQRLKALFGGRPTPNEGDDSASHNDAK